MDEQTKVDGDYKEAFNQGYELAKELGLKPEVLKDISAGNNRMQAMKEGMEEYEKELSKSKEQEIIPPLEYDDLDRQLNKDEEDLDHKSKDQGLDMDL